MKFLVTSDWHIHSWFQHSSVDDFGVPSRLTDFLRLAGDVVEIGRKHGCEALVFAGDWLQYHSPKPMVLNVAQDALGILSRGFKDLVFIDGNHDVDQKSGNYDTFHSGLRAIIGKYPEIRYVERPSLLDMGGGAFSMYVRPWNHESDKYDEFEAADVFLGHGLVAMANDPHGHEFSTGYNPRWLSERYKLSILGDIHNGQKLEPVVGGGVVLIPGQPIQINYSSAEDCGVWVVDSADMLPVYVPISNDRNYASNAYHRFFKIEGAAPADHPPYVHYKSTGVSKKPNPTAVPAPARAVDIRALVKSEVASLKVKDVVTADKIVEECFAGYQARTSKYSIAQSELLTASIRDFWSIETLDVDFAEWRGDILVTGQNGGGKSAFLEAIYWCLTGKNTKELEVSLITRIGSATPASVEVSFSANGTIYRVRRSRNPDALLRVFANGADITKASSAESDKLIYDVLGVEDHRDILALCYFSVKEPVNFSDMGSSQQYEILSRLVDLDQFEHFKTSVSERYEALTESRNQLSQTISFLTAESTAVAEALAEKKGASVDNPYFAELKTKYSFDGDMYSLRDHLALKAATIRSKIKPEADAKYSELQQRLAALSDEGRRLGSSISRGDSDLATIREQYRALTQSLCHECGQHRPVTPEQTEASAQRLRDAAKNLRETRDRLARVEAEKTSLSAVIENVRSIVVDNEASKSESDLIELEIDQMMSHSESVSEEVVKHMTEQLASLDARIAAAESKLKETDVEFDCLKLIRDKVVAKNAAINLKIYLGVFDQLVLRVNSLTDALVVSSDPKKSLSMRISFDKRTPVPIKACSTGEKRLMDVLILIALNSMIYEHYGVKGGFLGFAAYDEVMTYLAPQYLDIAQSAISSLDCKTKIVITHDENLMAHYSQTVKVSRVGGVSRYEMINFNK